MWVRLLKDRDARHCSYVHKLVSVLTDQQGAAEWQKSNSSFNFSSSDSEELKSLLWYTNSDITENINTKYKNNKTHSHCISHLCAFILKVPADRQTVFLYKQVEDSSRGSWELRSGVSPVFQLSPSPLMSCGNPITAVSGTVGCSSCETTTVQMKRRRKLKQLLFSQEVHSHQSVLDLRRTQTMTADVDDIIHPAGYLVVTVLWPVCTVTSEVTTWQKENTSWHTGITNTVTAGCFIFTDQDTVWSTRRWTAGGLHRCCEPSQATAGWYTELHLQS